MFFGINKKKHKPCNILSNASCTTKLSCSFCQVYQRQKNRMGRRASSFDINPGSIGVVSFTNFAQICKTWGALFALKIYPFLLIWAIWVKYGIWRINEQED